jgi:hypothetical protein
MKQKMEFNVRFRATALAASMLLSTAAFNTSFAESAVVSEQGFDWIFFAIVGIPLILGLVQLAKPDWLEPLIRSKVTRRPGDPVR